ncbi:MAG TPA: helix-turn-helix domain-containing protein [Pseudonocardiaceae bacterium]|nr:helix-turn-helix domain-containing protein [Pseudonocardiaceae bacterium]
MAAQLLWADEWDEALAASFNGLRPVGGRRDEVTSGRLVGGTLGDLATFHVAGSPPRLARTVRDTRQRPAEMLKICIQRRGRALIRQADREVLLPPGTMAVYDLDRPYGITLDGDWRCDVIAFPEAALVASAAFADAALCRATPVEWGPGSVLISLVSSGVRQAGPDPTAALMGRAGLELIMAALSGQQRPDDGDAVRLQVEAYIRQHLADPARTPALIAVAHHMSERSLHRLFGTADHSVAALIRLLRLGAVLRDLRATDDSIARVAARWGHHDMPHFNRLFKAHYGMRPSEARRTG